MRFNKHLKGQENKIKKKKKKKKKNFGTFLCLVGMELMYGGNSRAIPTSTRFSKWLPSIFCRRKSLSFGLTAGNERTLVENQPIREARIDEMSLLNTQQNIMTIIASFNQINKAKISSNKMDPPPSTDALLVRNRPARAPMGEGGDMLE
jgi:hypothetical protein